MKQLYVFIKLYISECCGNYNIPVVVHKSYEEWVEGIQISYQYSELVHDEKLCLCHFPSSLCFAVFLIHENNSCPLRRKQPKKNINNFFYGICMCYNTHVTSK